MSTTDWPTRDWLADWLALPTIAEQSVGLQAVQQLNPAGLAALLDIAEEWAGSDPAQSYVLAARCATLAAAANAPALAPRALYLQAQIHAIQGDFAEAEALVLQAASEYRTLGLTGDALRTTVGLMRVLGETGRYSAALAAAEEALIAVGANVTSLLEAEADRPVVAMLLQNCGFCYEQIGHYDAALTYYAAAEERYRLLGMTKHEGHIRDNRGLVRLALGEVSAGLAEFESALALYTAADLTLEAAQTHINIGEAQLLLGNYTASLSAFERALAGLDQVGETIDRPILLRHRADAYLALNLYREALAAYEQARGELARRGLTLHHALALWGMGMALAVLARPAEGQPVLAEAATLLAALENQPLLSTVMLEQSGLAAALGEPAQAQTLAQSALAFVAESNWTVQKIYAYFRLADLALPDATQAAHWLALADPLVAGLALPHLRYRLQGRWGHVHLLQGEYAQAQHHLEAAIDEIERLRSTLLQEQLRAAFLDDKITAYQDLLRLHLEQGGLTGAQAAFAVAERAKSRALADLITGVIQTQLGAVDDEASRTQWQSLQAELDAIYSEMLGGAGEGSLRTADAVILKARAAELERTLGQLRLRQAARQANVLRADVRAVPASTPLAATGATPLLVYHSLGDEILAFLVLKGSVIHVLRHLTTVSTVQPLLQRLTAQWARFRIPSPLLAAHGARLAETTRRLLHLLHDALFAPVAALLAEHGPAYASVGELVIIPHGLLHQLPFHALYNGQRYLVEEYAISYAPSARVFQLCQRRPLRQHGPAVTVAAADAQIPAVEIEAQAVATTLRQQFSEVQTFTQSQATVAAVQAVAAAARVLHLACHGLFRPDNPMFSALKLHDGWLNASEVAQLDLTGALVTLSACESGRSHVLGGDEILGLTYAFLSAGAASLVVSQWLVQDATTARLMARWYTHLSILPDRAQVLRAAQLELLAEYAHPYDWAPFVLVGKR